MRISLIIAASFLSGLPALGLADNACDLPSSMDTNLCEHDRWERTDAELNRLWGEVKPRADAGGTGSALLAQQRQWLRDRDAKCNPEREQGGSLDAARYYWCMWQMTLQRNAEFRAMLR